MLTRKYSKYKDFAGKQALFGDDIILSSYRGGEDITEAAVPEDFSIIGESAFRECHSLTRITVPDSVKKIGNSAFAWCSGLTGIRLPEALSVISDGAFFNCASIRTLKLPSHTESLGKLCFSECGRLETLTLPEGLKKIGKRCFMNCASLRRLYLPDSVTEIGPEAFANCHALQEVRLPEKGLSLLGARVFSRCSSLKKVILPAGITEIPDGLFAGCSRLEEVVIPEGVVNIGAEAFLYCAALKKLVLPDTVRKIGDRAFRMFSACELVLSLPAKVRYFGIDSLNDVRTFALQGLPYPLTISGVARSGDIARQMQALLRAVTVPGQLDRFLEEIMPQTGWVVPVLCYGLCAFPQSEALIRRSVEAARLLAYAFIESTEDTVLKNLIALKALPPETTDKMLELFAREQRGDLTALLMDYKCRNFGFRSTGEDDDGML